MAHRASSEAEQRVVREEVNASLLKQAVAAFPETTGVVIITFHPEVDGGVAFSTNMATELSVGVMRALIEQIESGQVVEEHVDLTMGGGN